MRCLGEGAKLDDSVVCKSRDRLVLLDGVLCYVDPVRKDQARLVVPAVLCWELMEEVHVGGFSGHFAVKGMYRKLARRYWWKGMYSDIYRFCKGCLTCASYKSETSIETTTGGWVVLWI